MEKRSRSPKTGMTKKEQAEQTRARVIDAAITLFAQRGFASTSTHELARSIGMTPGALYWHFQDKEALLVAVLEELERRLATALLREEGRVGVTTAAETARALIGRVARLVAASQETLLLVGVIGAEATDTNPRIEAALRASYGRIAVVVRGLLAQAAKEGEIVEKDLDCAAEMFLGMYMGAIVHQRLFRDELPLPRALPVVERMLFAALMPSAAVAKRAARRAARP